MYALDQNLRADVDQAWQWIVGSKEHPRPSCIQRELSDEEAQSRSTLGRCLRQPKNAPTANAIIR
jgi:hypothetical protein